MKIAISFFITIYREPIATHENKEQLEYKMHP